MALLSGMVEDRDGSSNKTTLPLQLSPIQGLSPCFLLLSCHSRNTWFDSKSLFIHLPLSLFSSSLHLKNDLPLLRVWPMSWLTHQSSAEGAPNQLITIPGLQINTWKLHRNWKSADILYTELLQKLYIPSNKQ